jgi:hypothetical protein
LGGGCQCDLGVNNLRNNNRGGKMKNHFMTPDKMATVDRVLNDILIDFPIIEEEKSWQDEAWNLMAMKVAKKVEMLKEKYENEVDIVLDEQAKYHEQRLELE